MGDKNKSGYELRSDLLGMAIGILEHRVQRQFENEPSSLHNDGQHDQIAEESVIAVQNKLPDNSSD